MSLSFTRLASLALLAALAGVVCAPSIAAQDGRRAERPSGARKEARVEQKFGKHKAHKQRKEHKVQRRELARKLDLTDTQRDQLRAVARQHRDSATQSREALRAASDSLRAAVRAKPRDKAAVEAARDAVKQAREASQATRATRRTEMGAALTPEQRAQIEAAKQARKAAAK